MKGVAMTTVFPATQTSNRSRVLSQAVIEAAKRMKIGPTDLGLIVGFSQPTASRLLREKFSIPEGSKEWELSAHFVRLYRSLSAMVGGDDTLVESWIKSPNNAFSQQIPLDYIKRVDGLIHACNYLDAHRATV
jgi:Protein of unknown function (DUF2384)